MKYSNFSIDLMVKGNPVPFVNHEGQDYIEGRSGTEYAIRIKNHYNHPAMFVVSVDGLSVINGKRATPSDSGYIVQANQSITIPGWLIDSSTAARFVFTDGKNNLPPSYAEEMGEDTNNVGWIGVAVHLPKQKSAVRSNDHGIDIERIKKELDERAYPSRPILEPFTLRDGPAHIWEDNLIRFMDTGLSDFQLTSSSGMMSTNNTRRVDVSKSVEEDDTPVGTGFGDDVNFSTKTNEFVSDGNDPEIVSIYYDSLKHLKRLGVPTDKLRPKRKEKRPVLTGSPFEMSYCKRPER